jgi:hypothetical protein
MITRLLTAAWLGCHGAVQAGTPGRVEVQEIKPLLVAAIDSVDGTSRGQLAGAVAETITGHFQASSPLFVDVSTERRFAQSGCSRLIVRIWQEGVRQPTPTTAGASTPAATGRSSLEVGLNYCRDGRPPASLR